MQEAARALGFDLLIVKASTESELDTAFATLVRQRAGALAVASDGFFFFRRERIAALAASHGLPTIFPQREATVAGGLMSYGTSVPTPIARAAFTPAASSRARSPPTCQSNSR